LSFQFNPFFIFLAVAGFIVYLVTMFFINFKHVKPRFVTGKLHMAYFSVVMCLLVWGGGWLVYEFGGVYPGLSPAVFQNLLYVVLAVCLSVVVWFGLGPKKEEVEVEPVLIVKKTKRVKGQNVGVSVKQQIADLEKQLWNTGPDSKERKEIVGQLEELEKALLRKNKNE
jgi:hypothetical protein